MTREERIYDIVKFWRQERGESPTNDQRAGIVFAVCAPVDSERLRETAQAVVEALFKVVEDTFYDDRAMQIDLADGTEIKLREIVNTRRQDYILRGNTRSIPLAWRALVNIVETVLLVEEQKR